MLGFAWTLLNPLVTMMIAAMVFSMILRIELRSYAAFLLSGLVPWLFFRTALLQSVSAFIKHFISVEGVPLKFRLYHERGATLRQSFASLLRPNGKTDYTY